MNIFRLSDDPAEAARFHCDRHVVKMCTEAAQILSTAKRLAEGAPTDAPDRPGKPFLLLPGERLHRPAGSLLWQIADKAVYAATHATGPLVRWVAASRANYAWQFAHYRALLDEYQRRYGRTHAASWPHDALSPIPTSLPDAGPTPAPQVMPEQYRGDDPVAAYRRLYLGEKARFARWAHATPTPTWFAEGARHVPAV